MPALKEIAIKQIEHAGRPSLRAGHGRTGAVHRVAPF